MLGDAQLQYATITPHNHRAALRAPPPSSASTAPSAAAPPGAAPAAFGSEKGTLDLAGGVVPALQARLARVQAAGHAYARALRLDPTQGVCACVCERVCLESVFACMCVFLCVCMLLRIRALVHKCV